MKTIILYIGLILSIACVISCKHKYQNPKPIAEFKLSNEINSPTRLTGSYIDKTTQLEEVYFADLKTKKKLYFFSHNGKLQDSISLKQLSREIPDIDGLVVLSKDTVFAFSKKSNIISTINRTGDIIKSLSLNELYPNNDQVKYEFSYASISNQNLDPNNILIGCSWLGDTVYSQIKNAYKHISYFYEQEYVSPRILRIKDFFKAEPKLDFKLNNFYAHLKDKPHAFIESASFKQINEHLIIYYSVYSNKLFVLNKDMEIVEEIILKSDFTEIGLKPIELNPKSLSQIQELTNYNYQNRGFIRNLFYDSKSKRFFLLILNENRGKTKTQQDPTRPFSIMVLDDKFNKVKEVLFNDKAYEGANSFLTRKGVFLKKISLNLVDHEKTYAIFNLE